MVLVLFLDGKGYTQSAANIIVHMLVILIFFVNPTNFAKGVLTIYFVAPLLLSATLLKPERAFWITLIIAVGIVYYFIVYSLSPKFMIYNFALLFIAVIAWIITRSYENTLDYVVRRNQQLLALDDLRSKFISDVSHELRTPINNISAYSQLLMEGPPEISKGQILQILENESNKVVDIINSVIDISKLDAGLDPTLIESIDIVQVIEEIVEASTAQAHEKELIMTVIAPEDPVYIEGDLARIEAIYRNLIRNAVSYSQEGEITINCEATDDQVRIWISDTGPGISKDDLPFIFERFYRGKDVRHSTISGSGLGLAIVKENVDAHKGSISVETQESKGTTFTVVLPRSQEV